MHLKDWIYIWITLVLVTLGLGWYYFSQTDNNSIPKGYRAYMLERNAGLVKLPETLAHCNLKTFPVLAPLMYGDTATINGYLSYFESFSDSDPYPDIFLDTVHMDRMLLILNFLRGNEFDVNLYDVRNEIINSFNSLDTTLHNKIHEIEAREVTFKGLKGVKIKHLIEADSLQYFETRYAFRNFNNVYFVVEFAADIEDLEKDIWNMF